MTVQGRNPAPDQLRMLDASPQQALLRNSLTARRTVLLASSNSSISSPLVGIRHLAGTDRTRSVLQDARQWPIRRNRPGRIDLVHMVEPAWKSSYERAQRAPVVLGRLDVRAEPACLPCGSPWCGGLRAGSFQPGGQRPCPWPEADDDRHFHDILDGTRRQDPLHPGPLPGREQRAESADMGPGAFGRPRRYLAGRPGTRQSLREHLGELARPPVTVSLRGAPARPERGPPSAPPACRAPASASPSPSGPGAGTSAAAGSPPSHITVGKSPSGSAGCLPGSSSSYGGQEGGRSAR